MKTICFIRHAKSTWSIPGVEDIDRPLNERGYSDAHNMAMRLKKKIASGKNAFEGIIITSPATRAISTAMIFARHLNYNASEILIHPLLYDTNSKQYSSIIESLPDECNFAILVGHNPVISETANLIGGAHLDEMPTCGIVIIEFDQRNWKDAVAFAGKMSFYDFPKNDVG